MRIPRVREVIGLTLALSLLIDFSLIRRLGFEVNEKPKNWHRQGRSTPLLGSFTFSFIRRIR
jgi:hypothetical protein